MSDTFNKKKPRYFISNILFYENKIINYGKIFFKMLLFMNFQATLSEYLRKYAPLLVNDLFFFPKRIYKVFYDPNGVEELLNDRKTHAI